MATIATVEKEEKRPAATEPNGDRLTIETPQTGVVTPPAPSAAEARAEKEDAGALPPVPFLGLPTFAQTGAEAAKAEQRAPLTLREIRRDNRVRVYIAKGNEQMQAIGYTEHGHRHAGIVATIARSILASLGYAERTAELAAIAGYLHDIGCVINRKGHVEAGALISFHILSDLGMEPVEIAEVVGAVGNHEEPDGVPINPVAAAVIIADKSDVHYSRVQNTRREDYDIHDRVNGSVKKSFLRVDPEKKAIRLELEIDTEIASVMEYFEIFITRMALCRKAADKLGCTYRVSINGHDV